MGVTSPRPTRQWHGLRGSPAGFLIVNLALLAVGLWCWLWPVRRGWPVAVPLAWGWVMLETVNGLGHSLWSLRQGGYTPGAATAPLLLGTAIYLGRQLRQRTPPQN